MLSDSVRPAPELASEIARRLIRHVIRELQHAPAGLLVNEGAASLWEEICVQTRREHPMLEAYQEEVKHCLGPLVAALTERERVVLWLGTPAAEPLTYDDETHDLGRVLAVMRQDDIVRHLVHDDLAYEATNYMNVRIREMTGE